MRVRLGVVVLGLLVAGASWMQAPAVAQAALGDHTVDFPAEGGGEFGVVGTVDLTGGCSGSGGGTGNMAPNNWSEWPTVLYGTSAITWGSTGQDGGCRTASVSGTAPEANDKFMGWRFDPTEGTSYQFIVHSSTDANTRCWAAAWVLGGGTIGNAVGADQCYISDNTPTTHTIEGVAPAGAIGVQFGFASWMGVHSVTVAGEEPIEGGDCFGTGLMQYDGSSVYTAWPGIEWGYTYSVTHEACVSEFQTVYYHPTGTGFVEGDPYSFSSALQTKGAWRRFRVLWVNATDGFLGEPIIDIRINTPADGSAEAEPSRVGVVAPAGVDGVAYIFERSIYQYGHVINGLDPESPSSYEPGSNPGSDGSDPFGECSPPSDAIDVPGWLAYGVCIVIRGFGMVATAIGAIPGLIASAINVVFTAVGLSIEVAITALGVVMDLVRTAIVAAVAVLQLALETAITGLGVVMDLVRTAIVAAVAVLQLALETAITGLGVIFDTVIGALSAAIGLMFDAAVAGIGIIIGDVLEFLFVPVELGDDWAEFTDDVGDKVPFGWFGQVADHLDEGIDSGAAALPTASLFGVSVTAPLSGALTAMIPYRGLILAGVAIIMMLGCIRWIMAAVGASPGAAAAVE
jgi:hypothetical protein